MNPNFEFAVNFFVAAGYVALTCGVALRLIAGAVKIFDNIDAKRASQGSGPKLLDNEHTIPIEASKDVTHVIPRGKH